MLTLKVITDIDDILDFTVEKSIESSTASYPRRFSREKISGELQRAMERDDDEVFAIYNDYQLYGVFSCFWDDESDYMQTTFFLIDNNYEATADLAIAHMKVLRENYKLFIGVPAENTEAVAYLSSKGTLSESSYNTHLDAYEKDSAECNDIIKITKDNFHNYQPFHDKYALKYEMYWNGDNLKKALDIFDIFAYQKDGVIEASIFAKNGKQSQEIYGLFSDEEDIKVYHKLLDTLLCNFVKESDQVSVTYFVDEGDDLELENAKNLGFKVKDIYRGFEL